jgi:uncharacterized cupredoxin-like copper-binding protein
MKGWSAVAAIGFVGVLTTATASGRTGRGASESSRPPVVSIVAREYAFDAPDSIEAGPTTIRLVSHGKEQHFVQLVRIASPHTMEELRRTLASSAETPWVTSVGGVGTIQPGGVAMTTIDLAPGLYALLCDMQDTHGTPHMMEGMLRSMTVLEKRNAAVMPAADVILSLSDYAFTLRTPLLAGAHVVEVRNEGTQAHMALLWRLHRGKSAADVVHWLDTPSDTEPPPVTLMGGTPDLAIGREAQLLVHLDPGNYVLICLVDDAPGHKAHYQRGMVRELVVQQASAK